MLVPIGATPEGKVEPRGSPEKELVGFQAGARESVQSWREPLAGLKVRSLACAPGLATGDGAPGFCKALDAAPRKAANALGKLPKPVQPAAIASWRSDCEAAGGGAARGAGLREAWTAPGRAEAATATLAEAHGAKRGKAAACLAKAVGDAARGYA